MVFMLVDKRRGRRETEVAEGSFYCEGRAIQRWSGFWKADSCPTMSSSGDWIATKTLTAIANVTGTETGTETVAVSVTKWKSISVAVTVTITIDSNSSSNRQHCPQPWP